MRDTGGQPRSVQAGLDLQDTTGIGHRDAGGAGGADVRDLALGETARHRRFGEAVTPGAATTRVRIRQLYQLEAADLFEQLPRRFTHALRVRQMAGAQSNLVDI